jgi:hypothetical protein
MKKVLKIFGILIVLLLAAIVLLPIIFKDDILQKVKDEANNNLNAKVDFGEFDLGLISTFPDFTFYIKAVTVDGVGEFEGVRLADIGELNLSVDLMSVLSGDEINIKTIQLLQPKLHVIVKENGLANYDIAKASEDDEVETIEDSSDTEEASAFKMALQQLLITEADLIYDDQQGKMYANIKQLNFSLSGDFTADFTSLVTKTTIEALTFKMEGIPYLNKTEIEIKADVDADLANSKYTFKENSFRLNRLVLGLDGWLALLGDDMDMDLKFNTAQTEFKHILSLIPAVYAKDFESVKTAGKLSLNGFAKGQLVGESYPAFGVQLGIADAMFKYPDLPKSVDNIQVAVDVKSPGGDLDKMIIDVSKFHVELAANPFDLQLLLKTPMSDPYIKAGFDGTIVLGSLKDVVPLEEGDELAGTIKTDIHLEGNQSSIDKEEYENFKADGNLLVTALTYKSKALPYAVVVNKMEMVFSPKFVALNSFDVLVGRSDFQMNGKLENFIPYALDDKAILKGILTVNSKKLDLSEFMEEEEATPAEGDVATAGGEAAEEPMEVVEIPDNIDFELNANFQAIHMDSLNINNMVGKITIRNQKMALENTGMALLGGQMNATGYYETTNKLAPTFDFKAGIKQFDVQQTVTTFNTVQEMAPLFKDATGKYSTTLSIKGTLNEKMEPDYNTLFGNGNLQTHDVVVKGFKALNKIADKLKKDELKQIEMKNVNIAYEIKEGKVFLDPFDVKVGNIKSTISGWNSFDQTLEYNMDIAIPRAEFGGAANKAAEELLGSLGGKLGVGGQLKLPEIIKMRAKITGTNDDPKVNITPAGTEGGDDSGSAKDKLKDELDKKRKEAEDKARAEAERLKKEAEAKKKQLENDAKQKADEAKRKAQAEADRKKKEAEQKAKEEADRAKKKAEEDAKKKLKGMFK